MRRDFLFVHDRVMTLDVWVWLVWYRLTLRSSSESLCILFGHLGIINPVTCIP